MNLRWVERKVYIDCGNGWVRPEYSKVLQCLVEIERDVNDFLVTDYEWQDVPTVIEEEVK